MVVRVAGAVMQGYEQEAGTRPWHRTVGTQTNGGCKGRCAVAFVGGDGCGSGT